MKIRSFQVLVYKGLAVLFILKGNCIFKSLLDVHNRKMQYGNILCVQSACEHI